MSGTVHSSEDIEYQKAVLYHKNEQSDTSYSPPRIRYVSTTRKDVVVLRYSSRDVGR